MISPLAFEEALLTPILGAAHEWDVFWGVSWRCTECYVKIPRGDQFEAPTEELNWEPWDQTVWRGGGQP